MADLEKRTRDFIATQNRDEVDNIVNFFAPGGARIQPGNVKRGHAELREFYSMVSKALGTRHSTIDKLFVVGNTVAIEYTETAQHMVDTKTPWGTIPASKQDFTIHGAAFLLFNGDKIEELRPYSDAWLQMIARSQLVKS